tara:strand:+ start:614 stop:775 length:162 start_codon:yes stop_codon:yes gene_type:complete
MGAAHSNWEAILFIQVEGSDHDLKELKFKNLMEAGSDVIIMGSIGCMMLFVSG